MYFLAVAGVIIAVDLVLAGAWALGFADDLYVPDDSASEAITVLRAVPSMVYVVGAVGTALVIFALSAWNIVQLASGGKAVATMVGARRVWPSTKDPFERRLMNVVEEMSIASGVRVPSVYVMDEERGINAFAAGYEVSDSIVVVTRGTLTSLNRDELQGVVAHEFSHILNGDMRLNIYMIGVLAGIVFVGAVGEFFMRSAPETDKAAPVLFTGGLALFLIGYIGLFFARLIKAAASRQREFLADASSVQFTRNPDGIAGALDQIALCPAGALVANRHAEDVSHMFFGQGIKVRLSGLFDTHPPLEERIERVHAGFDRSSYRKTRASAVLAMDPDGKQPPGDEKREVAAAAVLGGAATGFAGRRGADLGTEWGRSAGESAKLVGSMDGAKMDYAARLLDALPPELRARLREPAGACAAMVALLLAPTEEVRKLQLEALAAKGMDALSESARGAEPATRRLGAAFRMPVVDLALPAVKQAPENARRELVAALEAVIHADRRVSLHEFVILTLVRSQLLPRAKPGAAGNKRIAELQGATMIVLSLVAHAGTRQDPTGKRADALAAAMDAGLKEMGLRAMPAISALKLEAAAAALEQLQALGPLQKAILVKGLFAATISDGSISVTQFELMRLVGAVLDCPLPPLLESVDPATLAA